MLRDARALAGHAYPNVRWIEHGIEDAPLEGPYALATAGESLHWTDWHVALPRIASLLAPGARLAIVERTFSDSPWGEALLTLIPRYSTNQEHAPYDLVDELSRRGLFRLEGRHDVTGGPHVQSVDDYIESFHSANGFSRQRMTEDAARAFDAEVRRLVLAHRRDDRVVLRVGARVAYGCPVSA